MNKNSVVYGAFPKHKKRVSAKSKPQEPISKRGSGVILWAWVCVVMVWPLLRWIIALDCVVQLISFIYHLTTSVDIYIKFQSCVVFILHFAALSALTYFVSVYKPRGV